MKNPQVQEVANRLREEGYDVFDDWHSPGPEADDHWQKYETARGRTYHAAINGHHAKAVFNIDRHHLDRCDTFVLVLPAGKSAHMELGWCSGRGKDTHILMIDPPDRFDVMYRFANSIWQSLDELVWGLHGSIRNVEP